MNTPVFWMKWRKWGVGFKNNNML